MNGEDSDENKDVEFSVDPATLEEDNWEDEEDEEDDGVVKPYRTGTWAKSELTVADYLNITLEHKIEAAVCSLNHHPGTFQCLVLTLGGLKQVAKSPGNGFQHKFIQNHTKSKDGMS